MGKSYVFCLAEGGAGVEQMTHDPKSGVSDLAAASTERERERECVCVCVCEKERGSVCVCVCVCERERERENSRRKILLLAESRAQW